MVDDGLLPSSLPFAFHFDTTEKKPFFVYADSMHEKLGWLVHCSASRQQATHTCCPHRANWRTYIAST